MLLGFTVVGYVASAASVSVQIPQLLKTYRTRNVSALSFTTQVLHTLIAALWIVYGWGFLESSWTDALIIIVPSVCKLLMSCTLVIVVFKLRRQRPPENTVFSVPSAVHARTIIT
jgi:uncharacterized protein with PQ loop repeat